MDTGLNRRSFPWKRRPMENEFELPMLRNGRKIKRMPRRRRSPLGKRMTRLYAIFMTVVTAILVTTIGNTTCYYKTAFVEPPVERFCNSSDAWKNDALWRTSVSAPRVCPPQRGSNAQKRMDRQHLTESLHFRTPCGSHCVFHTDNLLYSNPEVPGWQLTDSGQKGSNGCWQPILDLNGHACQKFYKDWATWVEASEKGVPEQPCPTCEIKRAAVLASIPEEVGGRCKADISWKENAFWRNSVQEPSLCYFDIPKPIPALNLGIDHLVDSLVKWTPCGSYCIYDEDSKPKYAKPGSFVSPTVVRKGWELINPGGNSTKGCFRPIQDVRNSDCNQWYKGWTTWLDTELVAPTPAPTSIICPACDALKLPTERHQWDDTLNKAVQVPSGNSSTICGPRFIIVGAMGCGTDTMANLLLQHPRVKTNSCRDLKHPSCNTENFMGDSSGERIHLWETHGLSHDFVNDPSNWQEKYARRLPFTDGMNGVGELTIDDSPSYLNTEMFPGIVGRAKELLPNAKVVISLCNPSERLYHEFTLSASGADYSGRQYELSMYAKHGVAMPTNFTEFVNMLKPGSIVCNEKPHFCEELKSLKLRAGEYHANVRKWRTEFGREQVLVVNMEDTIRQKARKMVDFSESCLPQEEYPWGIFRGRASHMFSYETYADTAAGYSNHSEAMKWLHDYYAHHNDALAHELNVEWPLRWNSMPTGA